MNAQTLLAVIRRGLVLAAALAWLVLVWPTLYRYDHISLEQDTYPVRIHRLTGEAQMLTPDEGWVPMEPPREDPFADGDHRS